ncbi:uncharacterized protein LOC117337122 [Pecten maximus]|uniref:uncharacterized protein LOC117337122 n=1 Tax=Pecten maximus TaxID=6579 RepID=UPI0014585441|nr:uncharacterized protein LOC117337122 [Pecten maximus]
MVSGNVSHSYREIEHGSGEEPDYVSVQIKNFDTDWYSDGIGSSTRRMKNRYENWGGVLYGANNSHIRVWVPNTQNGKVFNAGDGWGMAETWGTALVKIRVWKTFGGSLVYTSTTTVNRGLTLADHQISTPYQDISSGMIDVKVKATGGTNNGFYFPADRRGPELTAKRVVWRE